MAANKADLIIVDREFVAKTAEDIFYKYKAEIITALTNNLHVAGKDQPGNLIQSIDVTIAEKDNKLTFTLEMEDYWKFVDEGVDGTINKHGSQYHFKNDGKPVNIGAMLDFIKFRGIKPDLSRRTKAIVKGVKNKKIKKAYKAISMEKARKSLAYAFAISQKKRGIKPSRFFSDVVNESLKDRLTRDITEALKQDIIIDIKASFQK